MKDDAELTRRLVVRRDDLLAEVDLTGHALLMPGGGLVPISGTDQFHDHHAHAEQYYLSGTADPAATLAHDPDDGWVLFIPVPSADDRVWTGDSEPLEAIAARTGLADVRPLAELPGWLQRVRGLPLAMAGNPDITTSPVRYGLESWAALEADIDEDASAAVSTALAEARRAKDEWELGQMRQAASASHHGHMVGMRHAAPGITERALQVEIEAEFFRHGAERTAYGSIVGSGPNAATLHFSPTSRVLEAGDLVLVDAGAEVRGYASDITRTYPAGPVFRGLQRDLYQLVLEVQEAAIARARPGQEYAELHLDASRQIAEGLVALRLLRGTPDDLVDRDVVALFFPHGLGHMLGLATHDAGGCLAGREPATTSASLRYLRADLPLQPGYVLTVEPGIYFIRALLEDPAKRSAFRQEVDWDRVDGLLDFGGIRIEDDILITEAAPEVLSVATPKTIPEIESIRAEALAR